LPFRSFPQFITALELPKAAFVQVLLSHWKNAPISSSKSGGYLPASSC
jgi:hypothetical protein